MNILLINHYAGSPRHGMEYRPYYLAREWVRAGHRVQIVAAAWSHVRSRQPQVGSEPLDETIDGIAYRWLPTPPYGGNGIGRVRNIWVFLAGLWRESALLVEGVQPDVVIASSTYPMDIWVARRIARMARAKLVYEVHDLWPASPIELSGMSRWHPFIMLCQKAENDAYRDADVVVSMLPKVADHMRAHGLDLRKLHIVPNGVALDEWEPRGSEAVAVGPPAIEASPSFPLPRSTEALPSETLRREALQPEALQPEALQPEALQPEAIQPETPPTESLAVDAPPGGALPPELAAHLEHLRAAGRTVVGYAGSHGRPNALDVLLDAAALLRCEPFSFVLVGDGHEKARLAERVRREGLDHIALYAPIAKAQIPRLLHAFDIAYIGWQRVPIYRFGIAPNKLMDYMMAGCVVLHSVDAGNDPVAEADCGLTVAPESPQAVVDGLRALAAQTTEARRLMGERGREFVLRHHTWPVLAQRFIEAVV